MHTTSFAEVLIKLAPVPTEEQPEETCRLVGHSRVLFLSRVGAICARCGKPYHLSGDPAALLETHVLIFVESVGCSLRSDTQQAYNNLTWKDFHKMPAAVIAFLRAAHHGQLPRNIADIPE